MRRSLYYLALMTGCCLAAPAVLDLPRIQKEVEEARELAFKRPVVSEARTRRQVQQYIDVNLDKDNDFKQLTPFLKAFGFVPPAADVRGLKRALLYEKISAYYDPDTATLCTIREGDEVPNEHGVSLDEATLDHELMHAMQDQQFDLKRINRSLQGGSEERKLAVKALIEGEAMFLMVDIPFRKMGIDTASIGPQMNELLKKNMLGGQEKDFPQFSKAPLYFKRTIMFPYIHGYDYVSKLKAAGGWKRANQAYRDLPRSTEQILHPTKNDKPVAVSIPALPLGKVVARGTCGEYQTGIWLEQFVPSHPPAESAAVGWGGDTYHIYANGELVWLTTWDDAAAAAAFASKARQAVRVRGGMVDMKGKQVLVLSNMPRNRFDTIRQAVW